MTTTGDVKMNETIGRILYPIMIICILFFALSIVILSFLFVLLILAIKVAVIVLVIAVIFRFFNLIPSAIIF